jgi:hypothetical protein
VFGLIRGEWRPSSGPGTSVGRPQHDNLGAGVRDPIRQ